MKNHFRADLRFSNWDFAELGHYLTHVTLLLGNMGSAFLSFANVEGDREFKFFSGDAAYEEHPRKLQGMTTGVLTSVYEISESQFLSLDDIRKAYS